MSSQRAAGVCHLTTRCGATRDIAHGLVYEIRIPLLVKHAAGQVLPRDWKPPERRFRLVRQERREGHQEGWYEEVLSDDWNGHE